MTQWGTRWHDDHDCATPLMTEEKVPSEWCGVCATLPKRDGPVIARAPGQTAHQRVDCPELLTPCWVYPKDASSALRRQEGRKKKKKKNGMS